MSEDNIINNNDSVVITRRTNIKIKINLCSLRYTRELITAASKRLKTNFLRFTQHAQITRVSEVRPNFNNNRMRIQLQ